MQPNEVEFSLIAFDSAINRMQQKAFSCCLNQVVRKKTGPAFEVIFRSQPRRRLPSVRGVMSRRSVMVLNVVLDLQDDRDVDDSAFRRRLRSNTHTKVLRKYRRLCLSHTEYILHSCHRIIPLMTARECRTFCRVRSVLKYTWASATISTITLYCSTPVLSTPVLDN